MATIKWRTLDGTGDTVVDFTPTPELIASVDEIFDGKSDIGRFASASEAYHYAYAELGFQEALAAKSHLAVIPAGKTGNEATKVTTWEEVVNTPNLGEVVVIPQVTGG